MSKHLKIVNPENVTSERVKTVIHKITPFLIQRQVLNIYHNIGPLASSSLLRMPPRVKPLSSSIGMGMEIDFNDKTPVISIDHIFLDDVLANQINKRSHIQTARYFVLAAASHAFVKDSAYVNSYREEGAHSVMSKAWKWAAGLALEEMKLTHTLQTPMLQACKAVCREREEALCSDYIFYDYQASLYDVPPPRIKPVEPWVTGLAFPMSQQNVATHRP